MQNKWIFQKFIPLIIVKYNSANQNQFIPNTLYRPIFQKPIVNTQEKFTTNNLLKQYGIDIVNDQNQINNILNNKLYNFKLQEYKIDKIGFENDLHLIGIQNQYKINTEKSFRNKYEIQKNHILQKGTSTNKMIEENETYINVDKNMNYLDYYNNVIDNSDLYKVKNSIFKINNENDKNEILLLKRFTDNEIVSNSSIQRRYEPYFDIEKDNLSCESNDEEDEKVKLQNTEEINLQIKKTKSKNVKKKQFIMFKNESIKKQYEFLSSLGKGNIKRSVFRSKRRTTQSLRSN